MTIVPTKLSMSQWLKCNQSLVLDYLKDVVTQIVNEEALGLDGFPCDFFNFFGI